MTQLADPPLLGLRRPQNIQDRGTKTTAAVAMKLLMMAVPGTVAESS